MNLLRLPTASIAAFALAASLALSACGGGSGSGGSTPVPPPTTYSATSGVAQKGPLASGSAVTVQELGLNLAATGSTYNYSTDSDLGTFMPSDVYTTPYVSVTATGAYADEVANGVSNGPVTLQSYADLSAEQTLNVNLLTTLAFTRIDHLVNQTGMVFTAARAQAEREVLAAFGIALETPIGTFDTLDLAGVDGTASDGDHILAAISSIVVQGRAAADVQTLITALQSDIGANGAITDPASRQALAASAQALDINSVAANLDRLYAASGASIAAGDLAEWLARDADGVIGRDEFVTTNTLTFTLPAGFSVAYAGATVTSADAQLWINGAPASAPVVLRATDVVALVEPARLPSGVFKAHLLSGTQPIARVTFVEGLVSIAVTPDASALPVGASQRFTATGTFEEGFTLDVSDSASWSSSAPAVADIDAANGLADALAAGGTTISAALGNATGTTSLNVVAAAIRSISLSPTTLVTGVGITRSLTATGTFTDGSVADVSASVAWGTLSAATATVAQGRVTGVTLGATSVTASAGSIVATAAVDVTTDVWSPAADMPTSRVAGASVTTMPDGTLLVIGGASDNAVGTAAIDLFDPATMAWRPAGTLAPMTTARASHTATLLPDGRVFVCGGSTLTGAVAMGYINNASAEIYDPVANTWTPTASMSVARAHHTATLLAGGQVMVAGGEDDHYQVTATAEMFDPASGLWTPAALPMNSPRSQHTATLLTNGLVLIGGGFDIVTGTLTPLASAELYDPAANTFALTASTAVTHSGATASLLADGRVLVAAGGNAHAEIFDPTTAAWLATPAMKSARTFAVATVLPNGRWLIAGGTQSAPNAERYDPIANNWTAAASMSINRDAPVAASLPDGSTLVCGGAPEAGSTSCEVYW